MKYVGLLTFSLKKKAASALPDKFALVIDGWSESGSYYLCVNATFSVDDEIGFESVLLTFMPLSEEDSHSAEVHKEYSRCIWIVRGKLRRVDRR